MSQYAEAISAYSVYQYEHLDDLSFISTPKRFFLTRTFEKWSPEEIQAVIDAVKRKFLEAGWEGDGDVGVIWLPPFVDTGVEDTWGNYLWHVKQSNNGTSFLLSSQPLTFRRIRQQNEAPLVGSEVTIIHHDVGTLISSAKEIATGLTKKLHVVRKVADTALVEELVDDLLTHSQGLLVRQLHAFLDGCYLRFLVEAINGNESHLKIRKSRVHLEPGRYIPKQEFHDEDVNQWFTLQGVVSDMWAAYKFEPYKEKIRMLFSAVAFVLDREQSSFLAKHVALRNCVQHHGGQVDRGVLEECGVSEFVIKGPSKDISLKAWDMVTLTADELMLLCMTLERLARDFDAHVFKHVRTVWSRDTAE